jgi:hypothetical protein
VMRIRHIAASHALRYLNGMALFLVYTVTVPLLTTIPKLL